MNHFEVKILMAYHVMIQLDQGSASIKPTQMKRVEGRDCAGCQELGSGLATHQSH